MMHTNESSHIHAHATVLQWVEEDQESLARQLVLCRAARQPWHVLGGWVQRGQAAFARRAVSLALMVVLVGSALSHWSA